MIMDKAWEFSTEQSLIANAGVSTPSTNWIDQGALANIGEGTPFFLRCTIGTAVAGGVGELQVFLIGDSRATIGAGVGPGLGATHGIVGGGLGVAQASLTAGATFFVPITSINWRLLPVLVTAHAADLETYQGYDVFGVSYYVAGSNITAGTITTSLVLDPAVGTTHYKASTSS